MNIISTKDLSLIALAESINNLESKLSKDKINAIINESKSLYAKHMKQKHHKISQAAYSTITDGLTYPVVILWSLISLISITYIPFAIIVGIGLVATLGIGSFDFFSSYSALKAEYKKLNDNLSFKLLQIKCFDELINRQKKLTNSYQEDLKSKVNDKQTLSNKKTHKRLSHLQRAIKSSLSMSATLFGTYYLGISAIVAAFGLSGMLASVLLGPIGIGITLGICFAVGIYFGYKQYHANKNKKALLKQEKKIDNLLIAKRKEYEALVFNHQKVNNKLAIAKSTLQPQRKVIFKISNIPLFFKRKNLSNSRLKIYAMNRQRKRCAI